VVTGRGCTYPLLGAEGHELPPDLLASIMILALELGAPEKLVVLGITVLGLCANTNLHMSAFRTEGCPAAAAHKMM